MKNKKEDEKKEEDEFNKKFDEAFDMADIIDMIFGKKDFSYAHCYAALSDCLAMVLKDQLDSVETNKSRDEMTKEVFDTIIKDAKEMLKILDEADKEEQKEEEDAEEDLEEEGVTE